MPNAAYYTMIYCMSLINNEYKERLFLLKKIWILNCNLGKKKYYFLKLFSPNMYSILGRVCFCFNCCLNVRRVMVVISLWHCWGGVKPRFLWQWPSAHLHFLVSCFSFSSWQYLIDSLCSGLVSLIDSLCSGLVSLIDSLCSGLVSLLAVKHTNTCSFNHLLVLLAVWTGAKSCWKMKSASLKSCSAEGSMKCSNISW